MHQDLNLLLSGFGSSPAQDMFQVSCPQAFTQGLVFVLFGFGFCCCCFLKSIYFPLE